MKRRVMGRKRTGKVTGRDKRRKGEKGKERERGRERDNGRERSRFKESK